MRERGFQISILVALLLLTVITEAENPGDKTLGKRDTNESSNTENTTQLINKAEKIKIEEADTAKVQATERAEIDVADAEDMEEAEATHAQAADAEQFKETMNTVEDGKIAEKKTSAQENGPEVDENNDDLFTMEHLGLDIPVKSAVEALNMDVLKQMLLKKLTEKLGKYAKAMNVRKKYLKLY